MTQTILIIANVVKAKLMHADEAAQLHVSDVLSYYVDGYEMSDAYRSKSWDGRSTFYDFASATFPAGFVNSVATALRTKGYKVAIRRKSAPPPLGLPVEEAYRAISAFEPDPRYDYQPETVRRLIKHGQMIAQVATGGGKSLIARTAVKAILRPTLFITTRQVLMYQMKDGFEEAGFKVGVMGDGEWAPKRGVNVATVQTIMARLSNMNTAVQTRKLLSIFELAILEEAHEAGSNTYYEVLGAMPNAYYRLSLTATPFMRQDGEANMRLMAISGQVGIRVTEKMLIERGILARPIFKYVKAPMPELLLKTSSWQKAYDLGIVQNERRNEIIVEEVCRAVSYGLPGMVLVQRKAHGETLKKLFKAKGIRADFIFGEHDQDRRARALEKLRRGEMDVLIGSTILDVGVDVPAVGIVALAGGGKAEIALRQRIGRGLRAKKNMPNVCMILDFEDGKNKHLISHYRARRQIIEATPGFVENILKSGQDYPYEAVGLSRKP